MVGRVIFPFSGKVNILLVRLYRYSLEEIDDKGKP